MTTTAAAARNGSPYFVLDSPLEVDNWRPLVNWLLYIPHALIVEALQLLARVVFLIYWVIALATGKLHRGLYDVLTMYERYNLRTTGFLLGFTPAYPPFDFGAGPTDNNQYQHVTLTLPEPSKEIPRSATLNPILAIPHFVVLAILGIGAVLAAAAGWFAVLFTGAWPAGIRSFLVRFSNYYYRVWSFVVMVEPNYPRFGLPANY